MGFLNALIEVTSAVTKVALTPVALATDVVVKVTTGVNPEITANAIESAKVDFQNAVDEIIP